MTDWQAIVGQHSPAVWRTAYRLVGNHADAADCLQETFISALKLSRRQRVRNWSALLRRLATARAIDRLRQRFRQAARRSDVSDDCVIPSGEASPTQQVEERELAARLREALAELPPPQAQVFCLRCLDDLSYREIARQLGVKTNAVGVLLHRARARLRERVASATGETRGEVSNAG